MPFSIGAHPAFCYQTNLKTMLLLSKRRAFGILPLENDLISNKTKKLDVQNKQIPLTYELLKTTL
jgi:galactose mutarotase-like enzyme